MGILKKIFGFGKKNEKTPEEIEKEKVIYDEKEAEDVKKVIEEVTEDEFIADKKDTEETIEELESELFEYESQEEKGKQESEKIKEEKKVIAKEVQKSEEEGVGPVKKKGFFTSLKEKLTKSREGFFGKVKGFFLGRSVIDDEMYEDLEEMLIQSDIGMDMTLKIVGALEKEVRTRGIKDPKEVYEVLKDVMENFLIEDGNELKTDKPGLNVVLVVGVNGVGKTTTIGKIASKLTKEGKKVIVGAGDTFRAAAIEQLEEWTKRAGAEIIKHQQGTDPGAVVFDTLKAAENRNADVAIIDTAGRLHNKNNLMKELEKINRIIEKHVGSTSYESILVIDGTTGQNGLNQAKVFNEVTKLTGFIVTKLDGTAKGGIVFAISEELKKPIKFIGVGEGIEDLRPFNPKEYIDAIFE
ncbi:signal recognition particle-docking protein FtsY [uncultured Ilyobacter sp.]|uniref:signal recognition particle-docking protein FtsY n=1 Tax=uncultured Ilyobacter sp. TaxID=544433 RepID=UPI0029C6B652|nr:signal recognition particle-docking protein FtsY [uncultured Ilyobacter sp.]